MKNFNRNIKAISPIFATLILIAIAVIAGVVVYMFTSGTLATMTGGGTAAQEKMSIQAAQGSGTVVKVYAQSQSGTIILDSAIIKTSSGTVFGVVATTTSVTTSLTTVTITTPTLTAGDSYTVTLVSKAGGNFVSPSFIATAT
jgi:flagellin-like protein